MTKHYSLITATLLLCNLLSITNAAEVTLSEQMVRAIDNGNLTEVADLVKKVDVNFKQDGVSLVERACFKGHKAIADILVKNGAIVSNYCMVPGAQQQIMKEKLLASGLEVTPVGNLAYVSGSTTRVLKSSELFFLRHGNTFATENKIFTDTDNKVAFLTDKGKDEIEQIAADIISIKPDVIITSSLTRCRESLEIVLKKLESDESLVKNVELVESKAVRGICHGAWEGKNKEELIGEDLLTWFAKWNSYVFAKSPGGESLAEVIIRASEFLDFIDKNYPSKRVLLIGHGSFSWALTVLLRVYPDPSNNDYNIKYGALKKLY